MTDPKLPQTAGGPGLAIICRLDDCDKPRGTGRGLCPMHYQRWRKYGDPYHTPPSAEERFFAKVDRSGDCWLWTGCLNNNGYPLFWDGSVRAYGHRFAYRHFVGPIPEGMDLDHLCRMPRCVNPAHLEPVTHAENLLRGIGIASINAAKTECPQGHPYDKANTRYKRGGDRYCAKCSTARSVAYKRRKRAAA